MSDLKPGEKRKLERYFHMEQGYVLDFATWRFDEFMADVTGRDLQDQRYQTQGTSKANRLRAYWRLESNDRVAKVVEQLIDYRDAGRPLTEEEKALRQECMGVAKRLRTTKPAVEDLDALAAPVEEADFEALAEAVKEAIDRNKPEEGLDRLHTFVIKYVRVLCERHGLTVDREKPLHSLFGEYVKRMRSDGHLESEMTDRILKSAISVLEAFNDVRNDKSLAHDNPILNHEESLLIFNNVANLVRFLKTLEEKLEKKAASAPWTEDIPF